MGKDKPKEDDKKQCETCQGTGAYFSEALDVIISCPWCNGTGKR
jgi:DnaJ-class molecular chaperone